MSKLPSLTNNTSEDAVKDDKPKTRTLAKTKKELIQELLQMEDDDLGELGTPCQNLPVKESQTSKITNCIDEVEEDTPITKPKRQLTEKQLEALKKGQQKRDENREQKKAMQKQKEDEERRLIEEKLVKKAISVKKKQIKKQALLDEISDDETPIQKLKAAAPSTQPPPPAQQKPKIIFV